MTHVDLAARARLVRLRGADDAGASRHLSFFFTSSFVWQRFLRPGELGWVCSLHGLRQAKKGKEVSEEYWLAVRAAARRTIDRLRQRALLKTWPLCFLVS